MDTFSHRKLIFGTISFIPKPCQNTEHNDLITIECIDVEDDESELINKPHQAPVSAPPPHIVNNIMCIDLDDSEEQNSESETAEERTISPVGMKGDTEPFSYCQTFSVIDDSPTINIIIKENAIESFVIEDSDSKEESEEEESIYDGRTNEPMDLLQPMFVVEDRSELEAIGFKCKYCDRILINKEDLKKEYQKHAGERRSLRNKKISCSRCKKTFGTKLDFEWHDGECLGKFRVGKRSSNKRITRQSAQKCRKKTKY